MEILQCVYRELVWELMQEVKGWKELNWAELPYEGPKLEELPGFYAVRETVDSEKLRQTHLAIHREAGFLEADGYWSELGG